MWHYFYFNVLQIPLILAIICPLSPPHPNHSVFNNHMIFRRRKSWQEGTGGTRVVGLEPLPCEVRLGEGWVVGCPAAALALARGDAEDTAGLWILLCGRRTRGCGMSCCFAHTRRWCLEFCSPFAAMPESQRQPRISLPRSGGCSA